MQPDSIKRSLAVGHSSPASLEPPALPILEPGHTYASVSDKIGQVVLAPLKQTGLGWVFGFMMAFGLLQLFGVAVVWLLVKGVGIWGINVPVAWGFAIINFVWWVGIGHAGTFISAMLLLMRQDWRTSINRFAEAMTLFAVACAGQFPLLHMGRPWNCYWLLPYPNTMLLWPQFRSPLVWDAFAVSTYATISLLFWYIGLLPDFATLRDSAKNIWVARAYGFFSLGWRGSAKHWQRYQTAYALLAALAAPLVISVHSVVSMDFAGGLVPGWHSTIFPPYFVAGAIFAGFAMVLNLAIPMRARYGMQDMITMRHIDNCAKLILVTGMIVTYGYAAEAFFGWYSGSEAEWHMTLNRMVGPYWPAYWSLILCNCCTTQLLWFQRVRHNTKLLWVICLIIGVGMWLERFVIIITSLHQDFLPSSWDMYYPTMWDWATYVGTIGLFLALFFVFLRVVPAISIFEMRELVHLQHEDAAHEVEKAHGGAATPPPHGTLPAQGGA